MKNVIILIISIITVVSCTDKVKDSYNSVVSKEVPVSEMKKSEEDKTEIQAQKIEDVSVTTTPTNELPPQMYKEKAVKATTAKIEKPTTKPQKVDKVEEQVQSKPKVESQPLPSSKKIETSGEQVKSTPIERPTKTVKPEKPVKPEVIVKGSGSPTHNIWNSLLSKYVTRDGNVNYSGLLTKKTELDSYLAELKNLTPKPAWSEKEKLAYWINVYNAFTVKLILDNYPIKSITELHGGKPWDVTWIDIDGKSYSLNNIENDIIRPRFKEPRIHFAVNCAAKSCPPLANRAFTADNLESMLASNTKTFVNNKKYNTLSESNVSISKIFDWYKADFGNIATFIARYAESTVSPTATVEFMEYDWSLNGK